MITAVVAPPRMGKTSFLVYKAKPFLIGEQADILLSDCCEEIDEINSGGFILTKPRKPPVFSDFLISFEDGYNEFVESYFATGFRLGMKNKFVKVLNLPAKSKIFLTEIQRYYNSRLFKLFPRWVSRFYEMHGHADFDIWLDTQRLMLMDICLRDLLSKVLEIVKLEHDYDVMGNIVASKWTVHSFDTATDYEANKTSSAKSPEHYKYEIEEHIFDGNIFECYDSRTYRHSFQPNSNLLLADDCNEFLDKIIKSDDYTYLPHVKNVKTEMDLMLFNAMYSHTAPSGFYAKGEI